MEETSAITFQEQFLAGVKENNPRKAAQALGNIATLVQPEYAFDAYDQEEVLQAVLRRVTPQPEYPIADQVTVWKYPRRLSITDRTDREPILQVFTSPRVRHPSVRSIVSEPGVQFIRLAAAGENLTDQSRFRELNLDDGWHFILHPSRQTDPVDTDLQYAKVLNEFWTRYYHDRRITPALRPLDVTYLVGTGDKQFGVEITIGKLQRPIVGLPEQDQQNLGYWREKYPLDPKAVDHNNVQYVSTSSKMDEEFERIGLSRRSLLQRVTGLGGWNYQQGMTVEGIVVLEQEE